MDRVDPARTSWARVWEANDVAWRALTEPPAANRARRYLAERGIDVAALERATGEPLAGYTQAPPSGLADRLVAEGFAREEIIDSGWAVHRDGMLVDRFRRRIVLPIRDPAGRVAGIIGRDLTGVARQRYLNTPETAVFQKRACLYRANTHELDRDAVTIVCEGAIDALAVAARAAGAGQLSRIASLAPSGTALTATQAELVIQSQTGRIVLCADADPAGRAAAADWRRLFAVLGVDASIMALPAGHDPASWLAARPSLGLEAFYRTGVEL